MDVFVYWGRKAVRKFLGFAADFCSIDRSCQPFSVFSVAIASHLYGVAVNSGEVIGYEIVCRRCSTTIPLRSLPYQHLSEQEYSLNDLISLTFPYIQTAYRNRLEVEEIVQKNPQSLPQPEREFLIREAFEQLDHDAAKIKSDLYLDKTRGIVCATIVGGVITSITIAVNTQEPYTTIGAWTAAGLLFIGIIYVLFLSATGPKRAFRKKILPRLIRALTPLAPENQELEASMKQYQSMGGGKITRFIKADQLYKQIQRGAQSANVLVEQSRTQIEEEPASTMQFSFYDSNQQVRIKTFSIPQVKIGSGQQCDLQFLGLAPEHCLVYLSNQGYYAHDQAGGLMINEKIGSGFVKDNDLLYLGAICIRFNIPNPSPEIRNFSQPNTTQAGWNLVGSIAEEYNFLRNHPCRCNGRWKLQRQMQLVRPPHVPEHYILDKLIVQCDQCNDSAEFDFQLDSRTREYQREVQEIRNEFGLEN